MKKGMCKHFTGIQHDECSKGVNYKKLAGEPLFGYALRLPCISSDIDSRKKDQVFCELRKEPTADEIIEHEKDIMQFLEHMSKAYPLIAKIKKEQKGKDWQGIELCPVCNGNLHLSHAAFNGHVWGRCETENCLNWME